MLARVKKLYKNWKADRQQLRELMVQLDNLTDYFFLARASFYEGTATVQQAIGLKFRGQI